MRVTPSRHPVVAARACRVLSVLCTVAALAATDGCTRLFFRNQADREVNDILAEKDHFGWWKIQQYHVYPDPRARFADPTNPDRPPMPPDDDTTYRATPHPQAPYHAGVAWVEGTGYLDAIKAWDAANREKRTADAEVPDAPAPAPAVETKPADRSGERTFPPPGVGTGRRPLQHLFDGSPEQQQMGFLLTLDQAAELGLINSREYQSFREDLYLEALPVTQQRFSFAWQFAATESAVRQWAGVESAEGHQNRWALNSNVGVSKLFSTGALLTAAFANNTVFNFLGHNLTSASSINLDFVQPLLRGGGKAVTLEPLTQAERNLFYAIRAYARFREQFYLSLALGTTPPTNLPAAAGATTSGAGTPISVLASLGIASTDVSGQFRGYLPTLYRELDMAVDKKYVADLERALKLFEGFEEGGQVSPLQVAQVRSSLLSARNSVLKDIQDCTNALDQFKLQLGVPANFPLVLDDALGRPVTVQLDRYYAVLYDADNTFRRIDQQDRQPPEKFRAILREIYTTDPLVRGTPFEKRIAPAWQAWAAATDKEIITRLEKQAQERRQLLDRKTDFELKGESLPAADAQRIRELEFESDLGALEQVLRRYEARPWEKLKGTLRDADRARLFRLTAYAAQNVAVWARNDRFDTVAHLWPEVPGVPLCEGVDLLTADSDTAQEAALKVALSNRVDLMNARAQVVDAWRQLRVTANALLGIFNVAYHLDAITPPGGSNPLAFSSARTNQTLTLNAALPLVRVTERNAYRTALINYQRARRNLMSLEDNIAATVRFDVRQLHLFAENYRIQQKIVESLYSQVENALEVIVAPTDPDALKASGTAGQANAAALTNQYLGVLGQLNNAQTQMYRLWLSLLATRMALYVDLERLPLDNRGVWLDESGTSTPGQLSAPADHGPEQPGAVPGGGLPGPAFGQPGAVGPVGPALPSGPVPRPRFLAPAAAAVAQ